jgi:glycosyltransferase involved in cell wall biosynthesis
VYYTDGQTFGGNEQALFRLMSHLDRGRWRPLLFHHPAPGLASLLDAARVIDIPVEALPPLPLGTGGLRRLPAFIRRLKAARPDVFHASLNWPLSCKWGLAGAILARVPAILATHNLFLEVEYTFSSRLQQRLIAAGVGRYIAISSEIARRLRRAFWLPDKMVQVIYNGVPLEQLVREADAGKKAGFTGDANRPLVLSVARYTPQKGLEYLIEAAADVPQAVFLLAGEGSLREQFESQARWLGLQDRILLLGHRPDVPDLLANCDLFVLPSIYEGMPIALLEAMGAGKPVIATDLPGCRELITHGENGWIVPAGDSAALAEAIQLLLHDPALAGRLARAGQAHVREHFSMESVAQQITRVYEELLSDRKEGWER